MRFEIMETIYDYLGARATIMIYQDNMKNNLKKNPQRSDGGNQKHQNIKMKEKKSRPKSKIQHIYQLGIKQIHFNLLVFVQN